MTKYDLDQNERQGDRMDFGELWLLLRKSWRVIVLGTGLVLAVILAITLTSRMQFRARGSLYLGELQNKTTPQAELPDQLDFLSGGNGDVGTEIEILKSQNLIKRAILDSGLNVAIAPSDWSAPRYLSWRLAHRDLRLLDLGSRRLVATNAGVGDAAGGSPSRYIVRIVADGGYEIWSGQQRLGTGTLGKEFQAGDLTVTLLPGSEGRPLPGTMFTMAVSPLDQVAEDVSKAMTVTIPKASGPADAVKVVAVDFVDRSPRAAAAFVDALMHAYLERRQSWKAEEATVAETFVIGQVQGMKEALDDAERKLAEYKKNSSVVALGGEAKGMIEQLGKYEEQRVAARLQVAAFGQIPGLLKKEHAPIEQYLVGEAEDPVLAGLSNNLAQAQQELRRIEERFTPDAPAAHEQQAQVDGQLGMVKNYMLARFTRAQKQLESLNQMIGQYEDKLKTVPRAELELAQLTRSAEVLSKMYSFLLERQQQASVTKASTISRNRILDTAHPPYREDSPAATIRIIGGALLGLLFGTVFVIARRMLAPTFQTDRELRRGLGELPVLAAVPQRVPVSRRRIRGVAATQARAMAAILSGPDSAFAEAFRHLRTNIYRADAADAAGGAADAAAAADKVLLITSPGPGDGKTLCTLSLAAALAADDKHVLVIEADLHRPSHHALFQQPQQPGLSEVLTGQTQFSDVIRAIPTGRGSFDAVTAGAVLPGPAELLSGAPFRRLLDHARNRYDFILIDSPPFPLVADALIMAAHADRVLTVLRLQNTRRRDAEEHLRRFSSGVARYGVVINDAELVAPGGGYGYYQAATSLQEMRAKAGRVSAPA